MTMLSKLGDYGPIFRDRICMVRREGFEPPWSLRSHSLLTHRSQLPLRFEAGFA
jgi:hypothetical protein